MGMQVCAVEQVVVVGYNSLVLELKDLAKRQSQDTDMAGMIAYLNSPTRLIRDLMSSFFTREVLASSSAMGGRTNKALDNDVIAACLSNRPCVAGVKYIVQDLSSQNIRWPKRC